MSELKRSQSTVIGVVLLVAVAVIIASVVAVLALSVGEKTEAEGPVTGFDTEYDNGQVLFTVSAGDTLETKYIKIKGPGRTISSFTANELSAGETISYVAFPGETVRVIWKKTDESRVVTKYTVPDTAKKPDTTFTFDTSSGDDAASFLNKFNLVNDYGTSNPNPEDSGGTQCSGSSGVVWYKSDSAAKYERAAPPNNGKLQVTLKTEGCSVEDSGIRVYAIDSGGNEIKIYCHKSSNLVDNDHKITCPNGGDPSGDGFWDKDITTTITAKTGSIRTLVFVQDYEGATDGDDIRLYEYSAKKS